MIVIARSEATWQSPDRRGYERIPFNDSISVFIGGKFESGGYACIPNRCPTLPVENTNTPPVQTRFVYDVIPAKPHDQALVRASSVIL